MIPPLLPQVIPLGDENPTRRRAWLTWTFIAVNVGVFVLVQPWIEGGCALQEFYLRWAVVPAEIVQGAALDAGQLATAPGAAECGLDPIPAKPVYLTVFTSLFLHAGWLHLLGNMLYLGIFGNNIEDRYGHLGFLLFYVGSGVIATLAFVVPDPDNVSVLVGASGAIAGVLGAYLVLYPRARVTVSVPLLLFLIVRLPALVVLGLWFVLQLQALRRPDLMGGGEIAYLAHVGGFVAGMAVAFVTGRGARARV